MDDPGHQRQYDALSDACRDEKVPDGTVNLYGHVHNEPFREGPFVNICVEHTEYRPLPLNAVRRLALARLDDPRPRAATTAEEIRCLDK